MNRSDYLLPEKEEVVIQDAIGPEILPGEYESISDSDIKQAEEVPNEQADTQGMFYGSITPYGAYTTMSSYGEITESMGVTNSTPVQTWPERGLAETDASYIEGVLRRALENGNIRDANVRSIIYRACDSLARYHDPRTTGPRVDPF